MNYKGRSVAKVYKIILNISAKNFQL